MKTCRKCGEDKSLDEFYSHKGMNDGHINICKECTKKRISLHRIRNIDSIREYDRHRRKESNMTSEQIEKKREWSKKYKQKNRVKISCHRILKYYVDTGKIKKPKRCEMCGKSEIDVNGVLEGHHKDYSKPIDVIWVCSLCHSSIHAKGGSNEQYTN